MTARMRITAAAALLALLGGCMVGPAPKPPALEAPAAFRNAPAAEASTARRPDWWRAFGDPILDSLEGRAQARNLDVAAALAGLAQSRATAKAAGAALLPAGEADAQAARARQSLLGSNSLAGVIPHYPRTGSLFDATAGASWEIDLAGGLRRQAQAARADFRASTAALAGARLAVAADVADAYVQLRGFQRRLALARRQEEIDANLLDLVRLRYDAGQGARREVDEAEASLEGARAAQPPLRAAIEGQLDRLAVLVGDFPEADRAVLEAPREIPPGPAFELGSPAAMLRARPDMAEAEQRLVAADARIGAALAEYYPHVSLQGLIGFETTKAGLLLTGRAEEVQGAAGLRWRLFDFGRVDAEVAAARGRAAEAAAAWRQTALRAAEDVETAVSARLQDRQAASRLHAAEAALVRARQAAKDAYAAGTLSLIEVIDADRALLQAQDQAAAADAAAAQASIALVRALGGGVAPGA